MLMVLGVHRSGTSVLTRSLECLGAVPSTRLHEPLPNNPKGFFEDVDVERFNEYTLLPALDARWSQLAPPDWTRLSGGMRSELMAAAAEIVSRNFASSAPLQVLKDPRFCVLFPFWRDVLEREGFDIKVVCAVRDPLSVARSLHARDGLPIAHGAFLYASNWITARAALEGLPISYASYDRLLEDPARELGRIAATLSIGCPSDFGSRVGEFLAQFVDRELRHSRESMSAIADCDALPRLSAMVFEALTALASGGAEAQSDATIILSDARSSLAILAPALRAYDRSDAGMETLILETDRALDRERALRVECATHARAVQSRVDVLDRQLDELRCTAATREQECAQLRAGVRQAVAAGDRWRVEAEYLRQVVESMRSSASWRAMALARGTIGLLRLTPLHRAREVREILASGLFDPVYYVLANPEVRQSARGPARHFLRWGGHAGLKPSPGFDCRFYLDHYPDVRASGLNPLLHYIRTGMRENRLAHPAAGEGEEPVGLDTPFAREVKLIRQSGLLDAAYYVQQYPDVGSSGMDPIDHFVRHGWPEGRNPSMTFDTRYYMRRYMEGETGNPLMHYLASGRSAGNFTSAEYEAEWRRQRRASALRRVSARARRAWQVSRIMVASRGGLFATARRAIGRAVEHGPAHVLASARRQAIQTGQGLAVTGAASHEAGPGAAHGVAAGARTGPALTNCRVLFVGCDGLVAGSQVLLLNVIKWLRAHTDVDVGTILLRGGELVSEYAAHGPLIVWSELEAQMPDRAQRRAHLDRHFGKVDVVYGNTALAAGTYEELSELGVPIISHVHELEASIRAYVPPRAVEAMQRLTTHYIACSPPVAENLVLNHGAAREALSTINAFIENRAPAAHSRRDLRQALGVPADAFLVVGGGTIYQRKGVDLFVETAIRCKERGIANAQFVWVGPQHWDNDPPSRALMPWRDIESRIAAHGLGEAIRFVGAKPNPRDYFAAADVFYLPSREDPFPLVCLEAAQAGTPIVCFEGTGGMPDFVGADAGVVVPHLDTGAAADAIVRLGRNEAQRMALGTRARAKVTQLHTDDSAVPEIVNVIHRVAGTSPMVSVIVPVYNQRPFLERRLESILAQRFRDIEVIIVDDASTDGSRELALTYGRHPQVRVICNEQNSGSPFRQWARGIECAQGHFAWIAEGDDDCDPAFLWELLPIMQDPAVALAYSDSEVIDEEGRTTGCYGEYYTPLDSTHWSMDYVVSGVAEINFGLGVKNTVPNVSATLFRRCLLDAALMERIGNMRFAGDWMCYVQLAKGRKIAFRSAKLNRHRKHSRTLTNQFNSLDGSKQQLLAEVQQVHDWVLGAYAVTPGFRRKMEAYLSAQVGALFPDAGWVERESRYPAATVMRRVEAATSRGTASPISVCFITTNDWSHDGGSEQLWIQAVQRMAEQGQRVQVVIRRWDPEPYFIAEFRARGVEVTFKDSGPVEAMSAFAPDLVVINIGDQDEGTEWYAECHGHGWPYVIVHHLVKEPRYWPLRPEINDAVRIGNMRAQQVLFTSRNNRHVMERRLGCAIPHAGVFHNPLFIDRTRVIPFPSLGGPVRLAMPSRIHNIHKGQSVAVDVLSMPKWRVRPLELHIYGHGPDEAALREEVARRGLRQVFFHPPQWQLPNPNMEAIWRTCHGLLMTSFMEGMPLVLLNAMFHGRVPIVTDIGGHREVVEEGVSGFIADEPTRESVDAAIERAWSRVGEWESIGARARSRMLQFSPADPVGDFIEKLMMVVLGCRGT
jgi:glycosyltransferase involved in cell wall biosynthesis